MRDPGSSTIVLLFILVASFFLIAEAACATNDSADVSISHFKPASGVYYPGGAVESISRFQNEGKTPQSFWVGYSVWNPIGQRYDVASHRVALAAETKSSMQSKIWYAPEYTSCITGGYKVAVAVWNTSRGGEGN